MQKKFGIILAMLLCLPVVSAEQFTTPINITTGNNMSTVSTEAWTASYLCNQTSDNKMILTLERNRVEANLTESIVSNLTESVRLLSELQQDSSRYSPLYTECFANLTTCTDDNTDLRADAEFKPKYDACIKDLETCSASLAQKNTDYSIKDGELRTCTSDLENAKQNRIVWGVIGAGLGAAACYFALKKKYFATPPTE